MTSDITVREIAKPDYPLLEDFLYHAIYLPPGALPPPREIIFAPELFIYLENFGGLDDCGVIAEKNAAVIGAA